MVSRFQGTHLIVYDDGDVQWHDLSKEEWTLVEAAPNAPEANPEPPAAVHRHGTGSDPEPHATSAPEPSGNSAEDLAHQPSAPAVAAAATAEPTAVIPDSQEDNGQLSEDGPTAPLPSVRASGHRGAGSPGTQGALLGTQAAAEALHILRAGGDAFILASQLPREEHPPAGGPTHKAPSAALGINGTRLYGAEVTPRSLSRLGGREESQPTGSSSQASQGQRRRAARPGSASIKDLLRAKQAAAQAEQEAMQSRQIYLAFSHSDPVVVSKAKALAEALPCVTLQQAVDE